MAASKRTMCFNFRSVVLWMPLLLDFADKNFVSIGLDVTSAENEGSDWLLRCLRVERPYAGASQQNTPISHRDRFSTLDQPAVRILPGRYYRKC